MIEDEEFVFVFGEAGDEVLEGDVFERFIRIGRAANLGGADDPLIVDAGHYEVDAGGRADGEGGGEFGDDAGVE